MTTTCAGSRADGDPCEAHPVEGSAFCVAHQDQAGDGRCGAQTRHGEACRAWPVDGEDRCVRHLDVDDAAAAGGDGGGGADGSDRCGAPTARGGNPCRNHAMAGADRCHLHADLAPTDAQEASRKEGGFKHGYFVSGFLDEEEREHFKQVLEGTRELGELKRHTVAALVIRANRMMRWEAEGENVSGFATDVFEELRKSFEAMEGDDLTVEHTWDVGEVQAHVDTVLSENPEILLRVVPDEAEEAVAAALEG